MVMLATSVYAASLGVRFRSGSLEMRDGIDEPLEALNDDRCAQWVSS